MKKLIFVVLFLPLLTFAQEKITLLVESNIEYAPIGLKLMIQPIDNKMGGYLTVKISEDIFFRDVNKGKSAIDFNEDAVTVDINEVIIGGGIVLNISDNIDFYGGVGIMTGTKFMLNYYSRNIGTTKNPIYEWNSSDYWTKTNSTMLMPMASFGVVLTKNRLKFSIGNETAFTKDAHFMSSKLNQKSFARLSSFTFGIGYTFNL